MLKVAIVGSGPAGYYTAEALRILFGDAVRIDILDRLPTPFGLIRGGVAPDHQIVKGVVDRYAAVALDPHVRFVGHVSVGSDVSMAELARLYHAVVLATGAPVDRSLGIPGETLPGVIGSAAFVGWYNGHPDFADLAPPLDSERAVVIGNGNVALDVARMLARSEAELRQSDVTARALEALGGSRIRYIDIIGRRGPVQLHMTAKQLDELDRLERAGVRVDAAELPGPAGDRLLDPNHRKALERLRAYAAAAPVARPVEIRFRFFNRPVAVEGSGHVERLMVERTRVDAQGDVIGLGEREALPCGLVVSCIGYRTIPIPDVPYDEALGRFVNEGGRIAPGLYCVGWARRGPTGTIGANRPDGFAIADAIAADAPAGERQGRDGLDALLAARGVDVVTFRDWQRIDAAEVDRARLGAPREKFVRVEDMMAAKG